MSVAGAFAHQSIVNKLAGRGELIVTRGGSDCGRRRVVRKSGGMRRWGVRWVNRASIMGMLQK